MYYNHSKSGDILCTEIHAIWIDSTIKKVYEFEILNRFLVLFCKKKALLFDDREKKP